MNEKQLTVQAIEHIALAIEGMNNQIGMIESFMMRNFREYHNVYSPAHHHISSLKGVIHELKAITATNKDHVNKLEKNFEPDLSVGMDENGNYRRGPVPQKQYWTSSDMPGF